jgi:6-phosphogluconolactonase
MSRIETFPSREALADAAASAVEDSLTGAGERSLVVAGGSTPGPVFDRLARTKLGWTDVTVTLTDERFVPVTSQESNEHLIRSRLLTGRAAEARFLPLKGWGASPEEDAASAEPALRALAPFSCVLLGMGADGHVASLFPGAPAAWLDPAGERWCVGVPQARLEPFVPRISLTAAALASSRLVIVLVSGAGKRAVLERVEADPRYAPPIASILRQEKTPVRVLWAP